MTDHRDRFRAEDALTAYIREQCEAIVRGEIALRAHDRDEPPGADPSVVHDLRVALRRLRSVLRTYAALLAGSDQELVDIDEDLRWLGSLLSDIRDADVLGPRLLARVDALSPELVLGPVREELRESLVEIRLRNVAHWHAQRCTDRFRRTMRVVAAWCDRSPVDGGSLSTRRLRKVAAAALAEAESKARKRLHRAGDDAEALHSARKAAKRLRYAAVAVRSVVPGARATARHGKRLQRRLGDYTDLTVERSFLRHQARAYGCREGHNAFTYGILLSQVAREAEQIRESRLHW